MRSPGAGSGSHPPAADCAGGHRTQERQGLLNSTQVAELLGISKRKVNELSASGRLPQVRFGRSVRFDPVDVWEFVERCKTRR